MMSSLLFDGEFDYAYDDMWHHRNRLTNVTFKNNLGIVTDGIDYLYDAFDRRIEKRVDLNAVAVLPAHGEAFFHDGDHTVLSFEDPNLFDPFEYYLAYRYLFGPKLDQILSHERVLAAQDKVFEMMGDDQWNVATILNAGVVVVQNTFDTFGNMTEVYNPGGVSYLFAYTGREWDPDSGLYYYRARWMDPSTGRFLSEDPIYHDANNPARYVGNNPTNWVDPTGMAEENGVHTSVAEEEKSGAWDKKRDKTPAAPISIKVTKKGAKPAVKKNNPKTNQDEDHLNVNPWLGRGGANAKVGSVFNPASGGMVSLEWVIKFQGKPQNCTWGRNVVSWSPDYLKTSGEIAIPTYADYSPVRNDTPHHQHEYLKGDTIYMYDQPGRPLTPDYSPAVAARVNELAVSSVICREQWRQHTPVTDAPYG